ISVFKVTRITVSSTPALMVARFRPQAERGHLCRDGRPPQPLNHPPQGSGCVSAATRGNHRPTHRPPASPDAGDRGGLRIGPSSVAEPCRPADTRWRSTGGGMSAAAQQALAMLDAFASVGAQRFDITLTDAAGGKVGFRGNRPLDQLRPALPGILN